MKTSINLTATTMDLERFADREDLHRFYADKGIDGLELMMCGTPDYPDIITPEEVNGIHLGFYSSWYDFWRGNRDELDREYGSRETWTQLYGGEHPEDCLRMWEHDLELAHQKGVQYVVFHVSECVLEECTTYRFRHTDEEICTAACEIINRLLDGKPYTFWFLVENLWWSGLTLTRPEITKQLLDGIHYEKKGIMFDTGHLLHTNHSLRTQDEAVAYIESVLDTNGDLCRYIKGMHLQQSLSGAYVQEYIQHPPVLPDTYADRLSMIYPHIFQIDRHRPFTAAGVRAMVERVAPEFLTYELITCDREEHENALQAQLAAMRN